MNDTDEDLGNYIEAGTDPNLPRLTPREIEERLLRLLEHEGL
jgi:hypothetical protein